MRGQTADMRKAMYMTPYKLFIGVADGADTPGSTPVASQAAPTKANAWRIHAVWLQEARDRTPGHIGGGAGEIRGGSILGRVQKVELPEIEADVRNVVAHPTREAEPRPESVALPAGGHLRGAR